MSDGLGIAVTIAAIIACVTLLALYLKGIFDRTALLVCLGIIVVFILIFVDISDDAKVNEEKLAETKDKWQGSKVSDR